MKIATAAKGYQAKTWKNEDMSWNDICNKIRLQYKTADVTMAEFNKLSKDEQTDIKNQGGAFVGGSLRNGVRKIEFVESRSLITLDLDEAKPDVFEKIEMTMDLLGLQSITYSTFRSTDSAPRLRVIIPLKEDINEALYEPFARKLADMIDIEACDPSCFRSNQLMFWPCYAKDARPYIKETQGEPLDPKVILDQYEDIDDFTTWPRKEKEKADRQSKLRAEDPLIKEYPIGTFCRAYGIAEAIKVFIPEVYERVADNRYHFTEADSAGGAVVYDDKFLYSHHSSDPAYGLELNAFDLVRIHKFGALDEKARAGTPFNKMPSFKEMMNLASKDRRVVKLQLQEEFSGEKITDKDEIKKLETDTSTDWQTQLERDKAGNVKNTLANLSLIIEKDPRLQSIKYDLFADCFYIDGVLPWDHEGRGWVESDLSCLCVFISQQYGLNATANVFTALTATIRNARAYHPVREYLRRLEWDGVQRLDTLLVKYLGAEDSELNRAITRKTFTAAVARVFEPGIKFDSMMVLVGGQGLGKSTLLKLMGREWFSDNLTLADMKDKSGVEKLNGTWIAEVAELSGMRKIDSETIKGFITRRDDKMRPAYGHTVVSKPRQSIFIGTTNETEGFLRDLTGNRRYLVVRVGAVREDYTPNKWDLNDTVISQIWAEAYQRYLNHEPLYLTKELQEQIGERQDAYLEDDSRIGVVQTYLNKLLPVEWNDMSQSDRIDFLKGAENANFKKYKGTVRRERVCVAEIWVECFEADVGKLERHNSNEIVAMLLKLGWKRDKNAYRFKHYGLQRSFSYNSKILAVNDPYALLMAQKRVPSFME